MSFDLTPKRGLIFRITHKNNVPWILEHGLHCSTSGVIDPDFRQIGNPELIERRPSVEVPIEPGGHLCDYIPFYFTPFSPMFYNIHTGYAGITQFSNEEIVILVSSLHRLEADGVPFVFTDGHAYEKTTQFFRDLSELQRIPWEQLRTRDFKRDAEDPLKVSRYEAETLVYRNLPVDALLGIACYTSDVEEEIQRMSGERYPALQIRTLPGWYF